MRRLLFLILPLGLLAGPVQAQHWNDIAPGRDLLSSTTNGFDSFRQRVAETPGFAAAGATGAAAASRPPIPILDWVPPPPQAAAPRGTPRRTATRRVSRPAADPVMRDSIAPPAASTSAARVNANSEWERSLAERERELDRLRRILQEDRLRHQRQQQPQLR